ncbi:MAG: AmmeMemoRadiSam system protein B [Rhodothermaceae bacterium]|nr:AmmeMemoRadiSam system protein B [Rhodothermaceae bacterium]
MADHLFNSVTDPVPPVRHDIELIAVEDSGKHYIYLHDGMGYATPNMVLDRDFAGILHFFDGKRSISDILGDLSNGQSASASGDEDGYADVEAHGDRDGDEDRGGGSDGNGESDAEGEVNIDGNGDAPARRLLDIIRYLDENGLLQSPFYRAKKRETEELFEAATIRMPVCAGSSYPDSPVAIRALFDEAFSRVQPAADDVIKALYAPHIDIRIGLDVYARAFSPLKNLRPKRVVILATSHYAGLYYPYYDNLPFMVSRKDFQTPLGRLKCDSAFCERLAEAGDEAGVTLRDRSHRIEHSIELHLLFLQYLWDHEFSIVPVLVGPLEELMYMNGSHQSGQVEKFSALLRSLMDDDTLVLISGDQAHVGRKFGDRVPASELFEDVRAFDRQFLDQAAGGSAEGILEQVRAVSDEYRICGFSPLYTWLKTAGNAKGRVTAYDLWDEQERESAVSYGSVLFTS